MDSPRLMDQMREALRARHYSRRTEQAYCMWVKRFVVFHGVRHPAEMAEPEVNAFLTDLAVNQHVSASTQTQALSALLFLYRNVIGYELGSLDGVIRARKPRRLPVVLTRGEVKAVLDELDGQAWLVASLTYGSGLRLMECLRLRVQDVDFARNEITVRDGKGGKDRVTVLPQSVKPGLLSHLGRVRSVHERDLRDGWGRVHMPSALDRKYPSAPAEWAWQWVFPQELTLEEPGDGRAGQASRARDNRAERGANGRSSCRDREARRLPHVATFVRDPPVGGRL